MNVDIENKDFMKYYYKLFLLNNGKYVIDMKEINNFKSFIYKINKVLISSDDEKIIIDNFIKFIKDNDEHELNNFLNFLSLIIHNILLDNKFVFMISLICEKNDIGIQKDVVEYELRDYNRVISIITYLIIDKKDKNIINFILIMAEYTLNTFIPNIIEQLTKNKLYENAYYEFISMNEKDVKYYN